MQLVDLDVLMENRSEDWMRELSKLARKVNREVAEQLILRILAQSKRQGSSVRLTTLRKVNKLLQPMQNGGHPRSRDFMPPGPVFDPNLSNVRLDKFWNVKHVNRSTAEERQDVRRKRVKADCVLRRPSTQPLAGQIGSVEPMAEPAVIRINNLVQGGGAGSLSTTAMASQPDQTLEPTSIHTTQPEFLRIGAFQAIMRDTDNLAWREEIATMVLSSNETEFARQVFKTFTKCFELRAEAAS